jgi:uncharacterized protein
VDREKPNIDVTDRSSTRRPGSRWLALCELALVVTVVIADRSGLVPLSNTPFLLALGWVSLRLRGLGWRDVGFVRPRSWPKTLALGCAAGIGMELLALFVTEPLIARLVGAHPELSDFRPLVGNLGLVLALLLPVWLLSVGEELVYRGYLMNRVAELGQRTRGAWLLSVIVVSALFGWAHEESQGLAGMLQEGFAGLLLGLLYLVCGRTLAVPILAHVAANTLAFVLIYFGRYPGV